MTKEQMMITALLRLRQAYSEVQNLWHDIDFNETGDHTNFPFPQSWDETKMIEWINDNLAILSPMNPLREPEPEEYTDLDTYCECHRYELDERELMNR